jgi:hypothetical protein
MFPLLCQYTWYYFTRKDFLSNLYISDNLGILVDGARGATRTLMLLTAPPPQDGVSTNSTTRARARA